MSSRVAGAGLALVAAALLAASVASPVVLPAQLSLFAGHPTVNDRIRDLQDVYVGFYDARLCNTGGDGTCKSGDTKPVFHWLGFGALAATGVVTVSATALALLAIKRSERRKTAALIVRLAGLVALGFGGAMVWQRPFTSAYVPIGIGSAVYGAGLVLAMIASLVAVRPPPPLKLRVADRAPPEPSRSARWSGRTAAPPPPVVHQVPPPAIDMEALFGEGEPSTEEVGSEAEVFDPRALPEQPPVSGELQSFESRRPATEPRSSSSVRRALQDAAFHGATGGGLVMQRPLVPRPIAPGELPAPQPLVPWPSNDPPSVPPAAASWASNEVPLVPPPPPPVAATPPPPPSPIIAAPPGAPTLPFAVPPPPPPPFAGSPAAPITATSSAAIPAIEASRPARETLPPPIPSRTARETQQPPPRPVRETQQPPPRPVRETQQPPPHPVAPADAQPSRGLRASVPMPARPTSPTRPPPLTASPLRAMPPRPGRPTTLPPPFVIPPIPAIRPVAGSAPSVAATPASAAPTAAPVVAPPARPPEPPPPPRPPSVSDGTIGVKERMTTEVSDTTATSDSQYEATADDSGPFRRAEVPETTDTSPTGEPAGGSHADGAPGKVALSTAPESLPPPKEDSQQVGPTPACPQCESPMSWVEEHLRFYCKSCRMYF